MQIVHLGGKKGPLSLLFPEALHAPSTVPVTRPAPSSKLEQESCLSLLLGSELHAIGTFFFITKDLCPQLMAGTRGVLSGYLLNEWKGIIDSLQ